MSKLREIRERDERRGELQEPPRIRGAADDAIRGDSDQQVQRDRRELLRRLDMAIANIRNYRNQLGSVASRQMVDSLLDDLTK